MSCSSAAAPGGGGQWVPRQGARLVHRPERGQDLHDLAAAAERAHRQAAPDDLAEGGQIGPHPEQLLGASRRHPETGDDLVEDQQRPHPIALGPQAFEEAGNGRDQAHVGRDGLDDDRGGLVVEGGDDVVGRDHGVGHRGGGYAGRAGQAERRHGRASLHQQGVGVAVVVAGELHQPGSPGEAPSRADGAHGGLGPAGDEAHLIDRGHPLGDQLGQSNLTRGGRTEGRAIGRGHAHGIDHPRVGVAQQDGAVGLDQIDVATTLDVPQVRPFGVGHEVGLTTDRAEGAYR